MSKLKKICKNTLKVLKAISITFGIIFMVMIILSFTRHPYMAYHYLGTANSEIKFPPEYIILMGADGMPGPKGLLRCTHAAMAAKAYPDAPIIIAMPATVGSFLNSDPYKMFETIALYGINPKRFHFETIGTNTYTQASNIYKMLHQKQDSKLLIVTSPDHMYRSILTFEKCGFQKVEGWPTFEATIDNELLLTENENESTLVPLSRNISIRYNMWTYLKLEIDVVRESMAIAYYKIKGYI